MKPFLLLRFQGEPTAAGLLRCADHFPRLWRVPRWGVLLDGTQLARGLVPEDAELRQFFEIEGGVKVGRGSIVELAFLSAFGFSGEQIWRAPLLAWIYAFIDPLSRMENRDDDREEERVSFLKHARTLEWRSIADFLEVPRSTLGSRFGERFLRFHAQVSLAHETGVWRSEVFLPTPWRRQIWEARFVPDVALGSALDWDLFAFELKRSLDPLLNTVRTAGWDLSGMELEWCSERVGGKCEVPFGIPQRESPLIVRILVGAIQRDWKVRFKDHEGEFGGWPTVWLRVREPEHVVSAQQGQRDIFSRQLSSQESIEELSSRMRAKLGTDSLMQVRVRDAYLPEERIERFALSRAQESPEQECEIELESHRIFLSAGNPAFLFKNPIAIHQKRLGWNVIRREGPERYELSDQPGQPKRVREYWIWELMDGRLMWVYSDGMEVYWHGVFE